MAKILAADDERIIVDYYSALFSEAGLEVETAENGVSALAKCANFRPDLLVLDVDMPSGGGELVFTCIRRVLQLGKPVIFVTGLPERVKGLPLTYQWVSVFPKPINGEILLDEVRRLLNASGVAYP
ncbi:MAG: response regulator [Elusimicrobiales bacterium]|nr:response regulator [Elusimicrobiales bacterium]